MTSAPYVTQALTLRSADRDAEPFVGILYYTSSDPYAVRLTFVDERARGTVDYLFSRALLIDGLVKAVGDGDTLIEPCKTPGITMITVTPDRKIGGGYPYVLYCSTRLLEQFVDKTFDLVALGSEDRHQNIDALIARLLGVAS